MIMSSKSGENVKATSPNCCYNNNYDYYCLYRKYLQSHTFNKSCLYGIEWCSYSVITAYGTCNVCFVWKSFALLQKIFRSMCSVPSKSVYVVLWWRHFPVIIIITIIIIIIIIINVVSCHRPFLPGTSLEPAVIPTAQASSFTLQYFPYYVWCSKYSCLL